MLFRRSACVCLCFAFLALVGCKDSSREESKTPPPAEPKSTTVAPAEAASPHGAVKACDVVSKADAIAVFGSPMNEAQEQTLQDGGGTRCRYVSEDPRGNQKTVKVEVFPSAVASKTLWASAKEHFNARRNAAAGVRKITPVTAIGDEAFDDGPFGLHVLKDDVYFSVELQGFEGNAPTEEQLEEVIGPKRRQAEQDLAKKVVANIEKQKP
jgi:hypothetical protein